LLKKYFCKNPRTGVNPEKEKVSMMSTFAEGGYNPAIREELDRANWEEISIELMRYGDSKQKMLQGIGIADVDYEDLIHEAILLAYGVGPNGNARNWNKEKYPDVIGFLISIIKSITNHKIEHYLRYRKESIPLDYDSLGDRDLVALSPSNPEDTVSEQYDLFQLKAAIYERVNGDRELEEVLRCMEDGISKPREIAEETGYDIDKIYNALKRLRRMIGKLLPNS
jgi:DNA-directed RNA polymerase specialized sigma24 family protein